MTLSSPPQIAPCLELSNMCIQEILQLGNILSPVNKLTLDNKQFPFDHFKRKRTQLENGLRHT